MLEKRQYEAKKKKLEEAAAVQQAHEEMELRKSMEEAEAEKRKAAKAPFSYKSKRGSN